ncbi:MAG: endonuclease/exonuclease/phosphatase family protein [Alphaproteobacteria bacterium]
MSAQLSFATVNLYNLQRPRRATHPGTAPLSADEYRAKLRFLGLALRAARADVFGFQELWAEQALDDAFAEAGLADAYDLICRDAPGPGRPQVALAARKGMIRFDGRPRNDDAWWIEDLPPEFVLKKRRTIDAVAVKVKGFSRPVLSAVLQPERGPAIRAMVAHLKSKRPVELDGEEASDPALKPHADALGQALASIRRTAESAALRVILERSMVGNEVPHVVMGDLNNGSLSVSTSILTGSPRYRLMQSARTVSGRRADIGLYSVERLMQYRSLRHTAYTHVFEDVPETLDHILVSEEFYDHSPRRIWAFREAEVFNDHLSLDHERGHIAAQIAVDPARTMWPTDHGIVRATFEFLPFRE